MLFVNQQSRWKMIFKNNYKKAYVWIWLPNEIEPVVAGVLTQSGEHLLFNYGLKYLSLEKAIPIYTPELPLQQGDVMITYADISKAKSEIGYNPTYDIETGINKFVAWYNDNKAILYT